MSSNLSNANPTESHWTRGFLLRIAVLMAALAWSYARTIADLWEFWLQNEDYSVGMLVPVVAVWVIWRKRKDLADLPLKPAWIEGIGLLLLAEAMRLTGLYFGLGSFDRYAFWLAIVGLMFLVAGRAIVWKLRWVVCFLCLMIPFPARVHEAVLLPLQNAATSITVFGLEMLGFFVVREGNVLRLDDSTTVAVTEACSGLRMMTAFVFMAAVLGFVVNRPRWQRFVVVMLSAPIAIVCNGLRGIVTACLMHYSESEFVSTTVHDVAGWAMMPLALLLSLLTFKMLRALSSTPPPAQETKATAAPTSDGRRSLRGLAPGRASG